MADSCQFKNVFTLPDSQLRGLANEFKSAPSKGILLCTAAITSLGNSLNTPEGNCPEMYEITLYIRLSKNNILKFIFNVT